jgi:hypothetical protein
MTQPVRTAAATLPIPPGNKQILIAALLTGLITVIVYLPVLNMPFYAEDPLDLGQVRYSTLTDILTTNASDVYYRPLTFIMMKAAESPASTFDPLPFHITHIATHAVNVSLLFLLAWLLTGDAVFAALAAALLCVYPYSYEAVARTTPQQTFIVTTLLLTLLCYVRGRLTQNRKWLWLALIPLLLSFPILENALLFGLIIAALEVLLVMRRQVPRPSLFLLIYFAASAPFFLIWLLIPKDSSALGLVLNPRVGSLLVHTTLWPVSLLLDQLTALAGYARPVEPALVLAVGLLLLGLILWRNRGWVWLLLALAFWIVGNLPVWLVRNYAYVEISPRVFYVAVPGLALMFASLVLVRFKRPRLNYGWRVGSTILIGLIVIQAALSLGALQNLYRHGSQLMRDVVQTSTAAGSNGRLLFVDVPDRFQLKQRPWPFGWWGMLLAPVSVDLGLYADLSTGIRPDTRSVSAPALSAQERDDWPYQANLRGSAATAGELADHARWADAVYRVHFQPDGALQLRRAGSIGQDAPGGAPLARFDQTAELQAVDTHLAGDTLRVTLWWKSLAAAQPDDTIFIHLAGPNGLVAQSDGDSLDQLIPLTHWRPGDLIEDVHTIQLPPQIPLADLSLKVGLYNRASGRRLAAQQTDGAPAPDDAVSIPLP